MQNYFYTNTFHNSGIFPNLFAAKYAGQQDGGLEDERKIIYRKYKSMID